MIVTTLMNSWCNWWFIIYSWWYTCSTWCHGWLPIQYYTRRSWIVKRKCSEKGQLPSETISDWRSELKSNFLIRLKKLFFIRLFLSRINDEVVWYFLLLKLFSHYCNHDFITFLLMTFFRFIIILQIIRKLNLAVKKKNFLCLCSFACIMEITK